MSSPFETFRKHRTYWMAGMVLLAILAFIVAPGIEGLMGMLQNSGDPGNDVVVRWSDGKVTSGALNGMRMQHVRTTRFLQALAREVIKAGGMPQVPGFRYDQAEKRVQDLGLPILDTNRAVCQTMIISQRAKQLGIEFDDKVIDEFIGRFCDRKISGERFKEILKETNGRDLTKQGLYKQLGLELSAVVMERIALAGVNYEGSPLVTPGSLWQNYLRLNQAARIEAYPVLTSEFIKQVKATPTDAEIRSLYEAGAANFPSPNSPEPGFRRRYQANVEYVFGSWNKLIETEKAKITPEALKAEYDKLVGLGGLQVPVDPPKMPETPATADPAAPTAAKPDEGQAPAPASDKPADPKPEDAKPADAKPAEPKAEEPKPAETKTEEPKAEEPKAEEPKAEEPKAEEPKAEEPKAEEPKAEEPKAEEPKAEDKPADPKSQSNMTRGNSSIRLVAFQDDKLPPVVADPPPPDAPQPDAPKPAAPDATNPPAATAPAATPPVATPPATPADAAPAAALPTSPAIATPATPDPAAASGVPSANPASTPMRTQTFEEAKDSIARSLAMNVVRDLLQAKLAKIEGAMSKYASDLQLAKLNEENKQKSERPAPIDLKKLAEAEGLTFGSTGVSDGFRMATSPIGRSMIGNNSLVNSIMTPNVELFQPVRSMFIDMGNATEPDFQEFVSWKTEDVQAYTPALTDVRDEVIDAWKTQKARELAREEAEKLADKLRKVTEEPWKSVLDTQQQTLLINPAPFTWMSPPREMFAPAQITFVQGLDSVGSEFMQRVFNTPAGQIVVAPNQGLTTYYLVRLLELTPNNEELRQNFEVSRGRARQLAFPERERMFSEWYQNIESKLNVQWLASDESLIN